MKGFDQCCCLTGDQITCDLLTYCSFLWAVDRQRFLPWKLLCLKSVWFGKRNFRLGVSLQQVVALGSAAPCPSSWLSLGRSLLSSASQKFCFQVCCSRRSSGVKAVVWSRTVGN